MLNDGQYLGGVADPTDSVVGAYLRAIYVNETTGAAFVCLNENIGSQVWESQKELPVIADGEVLTFDATTGWKGSVPSAGGGATSGNWMLLDTIVLESSANYIWLEMPNGVADWANFSAIKAVASNVGGTTGTQELRMKLLSSTNSGIGCETLSRHIEDPINGPSDVFNVGTGKLFDFTWIGTANAFGAESTLAFNGSRFIQTGKAVSAAGAEYTVQGMHNTYYNLTRVKGFEIHFHNQSVWMKAGSTFKLYGLVK